MTISAADLKMNEHRHSLIYLVYFLLLCFGTIHQAHAQKTHNSNDQIRSLNWSIIGSIRFELTDKNELTPIYGESIQRFQDQEFDLLGYLIPIKSKQKHDRFLLAFLPINQCFFCGQNGVPSMVLIEMLDPIAFTDKPIHVKGILKLAATKGDAPLSIVHAKLLY